MPDDPNSNFVAAVRRAGVTIPEERRAAMREAFESMQALLQILDDPLTYADKPTTGWIAKRPALATLPG
jgi:hypothetical protein